MILSTAEASATGGREGHGRTNDGRLEIHFGVPTEMGGTGGRATNPEQLLALGYAACFQSSMLRFAGGREPDLSGSRIGARIGIGPTKSGGFRSDAVYLMERADESCPDSRATRGNINVTLAVAGKTIDRQAA